MVVIAIRHYDRSWVESVRDLWRPLSQLDFLEPVYAVWGRRTTTLCISNSFTLRKIPLILQLKWLTHWAQLHFLQLERFFYNLSRLTASIGLTIFQSATMNFKDHYLKTSNSIKQCYLEVGWLENCRFWDTLLVVYFWGICIDWFRVDISGHFDICLAKYPGAYHNLNFGHSNSICCFFNKELMGISALACLLLIMHDILKMCIESL